MTRNIYIFLGTFVTGALAALVVRAAVFKPHANAEARPSGGGDYAAQVSNPLTPASSKNANLTAASAPAASKPSAVEAASSDPHADHGAAAAAPASSDAHANHGAARAEPASTDADGIHGAAVSKPAGTPVNTVCAICGMDVDPSLPTAEYKGQTIGFGCKMCPAKFKADPDRYGPMYLKNEVAKR